MERQLTSNEASLATLLTTLLENVSAVQETASAVQAEGGDCKAAFFSVIPPENRPAMEMQWPMISLLFGV